MSGHGDISCLVSLKSPRDNAPRATISPPELTRLGQDYGRLSRVEAHYVRLLYRCNTAYPLSPSGSERPIGAVQGPRVTIQPLDKPIVFSWFPPVPS
jgi:hypothetical protein